MRVDVKHSCPPVPGSRDDSHVSLPRSHTRCCQNCLPAQYASCHCSAGRILMTHWLQSHLLSHQQLLQPSFPPSSSRSPFPVPNSPPPHPAFNHACVRAVSGSSHLQAHEQQPIPHPEFTPPSSLPLHALHSKTPSLMPPLPAVLLPHQTPSPHHSLPCPLGPENSAWATGSLTY